MVKCHGGSPKILNVFEGKPSDGCQIKKAIIKEIMVRIRADYNRWPFSRFTKAWIHGSSFVMLTNKSLSFKF